jgi:methylglutaconyl-CoA hydratase
MSILQEVQDHICYLTLNRAEKHNAFDNDFLGQLQKALDDAISNTKVRVIVLKANGSHFSAGADLSWMQSMVASSEEANFADAMILAKLMYSIYQCPKPTIAVVQGSAFGGGAGLAAACDITIAATSAIFCFSEVRLGLIPAVISPYVIKAIGARAAQVLFISAEPFDAIRAQSLNLVHHCVPEENLLSYTIDYAKRLTTLAPQAMADVKKLVKTIDEQLIDENLVRKTAALIAKKRVSKEGQIGLKAFLNKQKPEWN